MLRALIWDVDGTLAETEEQGHRSAFNQAFAEQGQPWHWDEARYGGLLAITGGKERLLHAWQQTDPVAAAAPEAAQQVAHLHARKTAIYLERVKNGAVVLRPGVGRLLRQARQQDVLLAIATTTTPANVRGLLTATLGASSLSWFACIAAGDQVARKKPSPDVYQRVLQTLGLPAEDCLAIEDSAVGAESARAAGLAVLITRSRYTRADAPTRCRRCWPIWTAWASPGSRPAGGCSTCPMVSLGRGWSMSMVCGTGKGSHWPPRRVAADTGRRLQQRRWGESCRLRQ